MRLIGVDTGGTFTDLVYVDEETGEAESVKVFSTRHDPSRAVSEAVGELTVELPEVELFIHGTTVATNAILERRGASVGLVTTAGQLDRLDLQRCNLTNLYDLFYRRPRHLVERRLRREVRERLFANGSAYVELDEDGVCAAVDELVEAGAEVLAVCFLNSYANPVHERRVKEIASERFPKLPVVISSEVLPEVLEYERFSTTAISAYLTPVMERYLGNLERYLGTRGFRGRFRVMQGNGGLMDNATARARASTTLESGPAAGVTGAIELTKQIGVGDLITLDMGGTSTDVCLIQRGVAATTSEYLIDGLPMRQPLLDIVSVGAGGGSIAWIDEGGGLHVGPASAGADPGPASYGRGGEHATVTDAHVLLGRLSPRYPLGGILEVDVDAAHAAVGRLASSLGLSPVEAANGILRIAEANVVDAIRLISVERGIDPRDFLLVAYGGAGPLNAGRVAAELRIRQVLVPPRPGIHSALGLTLADLRHDYVQTVLRRTEEVDWDELEAAAAGLEALGRELLAEEGIDDARIRTHRSFDMRYIGQAYIPVSVPLPDLGSGGGGLQLLAASFHQLHKELYKHSAPEEPTEIVSFRVRATGARARNGLRQVQGSGNAPGGERLEVFFAEAGGVLDCPCWHREELGPGFAAQGPAIVTQMDSTTVVYPSQSFVVDDYGNILIRTV